MIDNKRIISGSGGGGKSGGGSARVAQEAPNSLRSQAFAKVIDLLGEGEWEGIVGGLQGVYLDEVPIQNEDGSSNFSGVSIDTRNGTLDQTRLAIASTSENTNSVGVELKYNTPHTVSINNPDVDICKVTVSIPQLTQQNVSNGDLNGASVQYKIEYKPSDSGSYIPVNAGTTFTSTTENNITGTTQIRGSVSLNPSADYTGIEYWGRDDKFTRQVRTNNVTTFEVQKQQDAGGWTTILSKTVNAATIVPFSFDTVSTSTYNVRIVIVSGGSGTASNAAASFQYLEKNVPSSTITVSGKTTSTYQRQTNFRLTGAAPWLVRVTRLTADSGSASLQNKTYFTSYTEVFEEKFRYPGSVLVGLSIDSSQFDSIPSRAYDAKMLKIKVPTNYDPLTRSYTGVWDGTFKIAWSDNPAWCFYDIVTNNRYGLGERIPAALVDKWALYNIAQYCDELVLDGYGGAEPRFTCNLYLQTREEAYKVVNDIASIFRGMIYWSTNSLFPVQDSPKDAVYQFTNANVVDGIFNYQSSNVNTRYNVVKVSYNDMTDFGRQKVEYVEDEALIAKLGYINETSITAFGCTSRGQARRLGKWAIYTNNLESDAVNFSVGLDGAIVKPGDIIKIADSVRSGTRIGGRVKQSSTVATIVLDNPATFVSGVNYTIGIINTSGVLEEQSIVNPVATTNTITVAAPFTTTPTIGSIYIISSDALVPQTFKVLAISEVESHKYAIDAISHNPTKFQFIETDDPLTVPTTSTVPVSALKPTEVVASETLYLSAVEVKSKIVVAWKTVDFASSYIVSYKREDDNRVSVTTDINTVEILDSSAGLYTISVTTVDLLGRKSSPTAITFEALGKIAPPQSVTNLSVTAFNSSGLARWDAHPDLDVQVGGRIVIKHTTKTSGYVWEDGITVADVPGNSTQTTVPLLDGTYMAKAMDSSGSWSIYAAFAASNYAVLQNLNVVATQVESTDFVGNKTNLIAIDNILKLVGSTSMDQMTENIDTIAQFDLLGGLVATYGEYEFSEVIDLGSIYTSRVSATIEALGKDEADLIDLRTESIDLWDVFDGQVVNDVSVTLYVSTTEDDPLATPTWSDYRPFLISDYKARALRFKLVFNSTNADHNIYVSYLSVSVDMPDRVEGVENISCPATGVSIVFGAPFVDTPAIAINIDGMQQGDYYTISGKSKSGFTITVYDKNNIAVSRQIDWIAKGFGFQHI